MPGAALALVVAAAVLHAVWNALAKQGRDQLLFLWSSVTLASLALGPWAWAWLPAGGLGPAALPFVGATIVLHALYFWALGRAYGSGEFSRVYPIARQLAVHSRRSAPRRASTTGSSRRLEPTPMSVMYGTGCSRATPALSTSE